MNVSPNRTSSVLFVPCPTIGPDWVNFERAFSRLYDLVPEAVPILQTAVPEAKLILLLVVLRLILFTAEGRLVPGSTIFIDGFESGDTSKWN